jgi:hypothetical protein
MLKILDYLEEEVRSIREEAIKLEKKYRRTEKSLKKEANLRLCETLRSFLVREIETATERINDEIAAKEEDFKSFPNFYEGKEIWVFACRRSINERSYFSFYVTEMRKQYARQFVTRMERKYQFRFARADEFGRRVETLKSSIMKGSVDRILKMKGEEALWEVVGCNGELLPHQPKRAAD